MRVLGIDGGIASIGWALIEEDGNPGGVVAAGVRMFDAPETDKERKPTNALRRMHRGQRRVVRRRRQRMAAIRLLLVSNGLIAAAERDALALPGLDPWVLRADGLDRRLSGQEFTVVLGHIARHRGFRSNSKRDRGANAADDSSKMLKAIDATRDRLGQWRTVGEMFAHDPYFAERKHNRSADYSRSVLRIDQEREVRALFDAQRRLGSAFAAEDFEAAFADTAFSQRPLQDSEHLVQSCPFEPTERRTARRGYSFELFRLLSRLANLRLVAGRAEPLSLTAAQIAAVAADFGAQKKITFKSVRKALDLHPGTRFDDVSPEDESRDVVARMGNAAEGTYTLRNKVLKDGVWRGLVHSPTLLDRIAEVVTFREALGSIRTGLEEIQLEPPVIEAVMAGVERGEFSAFSGAGHISAKAARRLIKPLRRGLGYAEACEEVGYDHAAQRAVSMEDVRNPVARKALGEMLKQVRAIVHEYGLPDRIHVELARDVGKSAEERDKLSRGIEDRNKEKGKRRAEFRDLLGCDPGNEDLLRYELWKEQNGRCLYSDEKIDPQQIVASDNSVQVDHILPWSRFGDDSFVNKTLCTAKANQAKRGRTPFEWFEAEKTAPEWEAFERRVEGCKAMRGPKKRGYLRRNAKEVEEKFKARNLGDTRYATRVLLGMLSRLYPPGTPCVLARAGKLTARLRQAWGLEWIKKDEAGKRREDDRHHALDAIVVAATTQSMLQRLTTAFQQAEQLGSARSFPHVDEPWAGFRDAVIAAVAAVFVSRAERRRARGEAHAATIRQVRVIDGRETICDRKPIEKLTLKDLDLIPIPAPYGKIANPAKLRDEMVGALRQWIEADKPKDRPPLFNGKPVRKVRVASKDKVGVQVRGGTADRGEMARVDVFTRKVKNGSKRFYMVPVYPHQVADRDEFPTPPNRAIAAHKPEPEWPIMGADASYLFSFYPNSLIEVTKSDGEVVLGYFRNADRGGGNIDLYEPSNSTQPIARPGFATLVACRKLNIDRLGRVSEIERETRTWRGVVCT